MASRLVVLSVLLVSVSAGCSDECASVRCGCSEGSTVFVQLPGAPDGTTVTADTLTCPPVMASRSDCTSLTMPYPQRALIGAPGYASVEVSLARVSNGGCCPCMGSEAYQTLVMLEPSVTDSGPPRDGGDLPICPSPAPMEGAACTTGESCQIPGSPCFFVFSCVDAMWTPETICPPPDAG